MLTIESTKSYTSEISWGNLKKQLDDFPSGKVFAVVDDEVILFYESRLKERLGCKHFEIKASEENKCQDNVNKIYNFLLKNNADRSSILLSVGGGVTSDITGFVASIYKRGIPWISIPTTLLAQVDASVGGKTAINTEFGKNTIGSFYPPRKVIMTLEPAQTWTDEIYLEGIAEIIKMLLVFDLPKLVPLFSKGMKGFDDELVKRSVELKADVVKIDPWENNLRASLNYGHTFGHAIEAVLGLRHGLAVSHGIRIANRVSELVNIMSSSRADDIDNLLDSLDFPKMNPSLDFETILPFIRQDKKVVDNNIMMILIDGVNPLPLEPISPLKPVKISILEEGYNIAVKKNS